MYALHNIHSALVPNGLLVDTQPISAQPHVTANVAELGALDMSEWLETTHAVDARVNETIAAGLYELTDSESSSSRASSTTGSTAARSPGLARDTRSAAAR